MFVGWARRVVSREEGSCGLILKNKINKTLVVEGIIQPFSSPPLINMHQVWCINLPYEVNIYHFFLRLLSSLLEIFPTQTFDFPPPKKTQISNRQYFLPLIPSSFMFLTTCIITASLLETLPDHIDLLSGISSIIEATPIQFRPEGGVESVTAQSFAFSMKTYQKFKTIHNMEASGLDHSYSPAQRSRLGHSATLVLGSLFSFLFFFVFRPTLRLAICLFIYGGTRVYYRRIVTVRRRRSTGRKTRKQSSTPPRIQTGRPVSNPVVCRVILLSSRTLAMTRNRTQDHRAV